MLHRNRAQAGSRHPVTLDGVDYGELGHMPAPLMSRRRKFRRRRPSRHARQIFSRPMARAESAAA